MGLRTRRTKGHGSAKAALSLVFKLAQCAEKSSYRFRGSQNLVEVINANFRLEDGVRVAVGSRFQSIKFDNFSQNKI